MAHLDLKLEPASPGRARAFIRRLLAGWGIDIDVIGDAELLVTELVTNAVIHARSPVSLDVSRNQDFIDFSISDRGPGRVELRSPGPKSVTGRGIFLLDQIAPDWEVVDETGPGKTVRFSLSTEPVVSGSQHGH